MKTNDTLFWVWLSEALGAGNRDFKRLIHFYKSPYEIFNAEESELERVPDIAQKTVLRLCDKGLSRATDILEACEKLGIGVLPYDSQLFPPQLKELSRPPVLLYCKGDPFEMKELLTVGMVGTRRMSAYGLHNAYRIAYRIARAGAVVVSGMAAGIDGVCSAAAIKAGGKTIAVLGCGLDRVYPKHHGPLMREIGQTGLLLSEYPPGTPPNHYNFPMRNRLISGLSQTTVVVEAGLGSGSLITAKDAISQGKTVFAVPANVGSRAAEGSNGLLRDGARVAVCAEDILQPFAYAYAKHLDCERMQRVGDEESKADYRYLERLGVIELTESEQDTQVPAPPQMKDPPKNKRRSVEKREASSRHTDLPPTEAEQPDKMKKQSPEEVISALTAAQKAVFEAMPDDRAISVDALSGLDYPYGEIVAALTMLEIMGLIHKLPGALYMKA